MKLNFCLMGLLCLFFKASSQNKIPVSALRLGDNVPDYTITHIINYKTGAVKVSDFKNELLVIDFWATWCSSCMEGLAKSSELIKKFPDKLAILPVNNEAVAKVKTAYLSNNVLKTFNPVSVLEDVFFNQLFPHTYLPHLVWIMNGKYIGATPGDYLTEKTIAAVLKGNYSVLDQKNDVNKFDYTKSLFPVGSNEQLTGYRPMITSSFGRYTPGLTLKAGLVKDPVTGQKRMYFINHSILHLYTLALNTPLAITPNRTILEVDDREKYVKPANALSLAWEKNNCYTYEIKADSGFSADRLRARLKNDLDNAFGLNARVIIRDVPCLLLAVADSSLMVTKYTSTETELREYAKQKFMHHIKTADILYQLNLVSLDLPVVEDSPAARFFDLDLSRVPGSLTEWEGALKTIGLKLIRTHRQMPMFVLTEVNRTPGNFYSKK